VWFPGAMVSGEPERAARRHAFALACSERCALMRIGHLLVTPIASTWA
jgi:hypothetical protein